MPKTERILGAIIAGGASRRFGSDKALVLIQGRPMLAHVADALRPHVAALVVCGRSWPGERSLADLHKERLGPLAGLEAALHHAALHDFDAVLTAPVDTLPLPKHLFERLLGGGPTALATQHLIGYWPVGYGNALSAYLSSGRRDVTGWIARSGTRLIAEPNNLQNVNAPTDLDLLKQVTDLARTSSVVGTGRN